MSASVREYSVVSEQTGEVIEGLAVTRTFNPKSKKDLADARALIEERCDKHPSFAGMGVTKAQWAELLLTNVKKEFTVTQFGNLRYA